MRPPPQARTEPNDAVTARALKALWSAPGVLGHLFIIKALIIRNLRMNYGRNPIRILTELARPTAVIVAHYVLFWILRRPMPGNVPIIVFVLGGFSVWFAFNAAETGASTGAKHAGGIFALNGVTGMHLRSAKAFWPFLVTLTYCLLAPVVLNFYGSDLSPPNLISTCAIFGVTGAFGFGFGLLFERMNQLWSGVKILEKLLIWVIFVSMGLYFSVAHMRPPILARIMLYNPLLHLVEYERHAFDPAYPISQLSLLYPALFAAITLFLGLAAVKCLPAED